MAANGTVQWPQGSLPRERIAAQVDAGEWHVVRDGAGLVATVRLLWSDPDFWGDDTTPAVYVHGLMVDRGHTGEGSAPPCWTGPPQRGRAAGVGPVPPRLPHDQPRDLRAYYEAYGFTAVGQRDFADFSCTLPELDLRGDGCRWAFVAWPHDAAAADLSRGRDLVGRHRAARRRGGEGVLRRGPRLDVPGRHAARAAVPVRDRPGRRSGRRGHRRPCGPGRGRAGRPVVAHVRRRRRPRRRARRGRRGGRHGHHRSHGRGRGRHVGRRSPTRRAPVLRLWQANRRLGAQIVNAPGAWNFSDLHTGDPAGAPAFYVPVFGWEVADVGFGHADPRARATATTSPPRSTPTSTSARRRVAPPGFADAIGWVAPARADETAPLARHVRRGRPRRDRRAGHRARRRGAGDRGHRWTRTATVRDPQGAVFTASQFTRQ